MDLKKLELKIARVSILINWELKWEVLVLINLMKT